MKHKGKKIHKQAPASVTIETLQQDETDEYIASKKHKGGKIHKKAPASVTIETLQQDATDEYIDRVIDCIAGDKGGDIIRKYQPARYWLWSSWKGTVFQHGIPKAIFLMIISATVSLTLSHSTGEGFWAYTGEVDPNNQFIAQLKVFDKLWKYCMSLTTFILTFFLNQAYTFWRDMYKKGRTVQGRLNDIGMLLATHAKRDPRTGKYTPESMAFLDEIAVYLRLFSPFVWASHSRHFRVLLTERGMNRMVARGILSQKQMETLLELDIPRNKMYIACMEWALIRIRKAYDSGVLEGDHSLYHTLLHIFCALRSSGSQPGHAINGRMPLVYAHFVQVLVDCFIFSAPLALYAELGSMSVFCVGMLTLFYEGLLDLAKVFLDPLENEDYCDGGIEMDLGLLIRESNAGSRNWKNAAAKLPFVA